MNESSVFTLLWRGKLYTKKAEKSGEKKIISDYSYVSAAHNIKKFPLTVFVKCYLIVVDTKIDLKWKWQNIKYKETAEKV